MEYALIIVKRLSPKSCGHQGDLMYEFDLSRWQNTQSMEASNKQKHKLLLFICALLSAIYIPLIYVNYASGFYLLAVLNGMFVVSLITASLYMYRRNTSLPKLIIALVLGLLAFSATTPIAFVGVKGTFWCFPILVSSAFILPQRVGIALNTSVIILCGIFGFQTLPRGEWLRLEFALIASGLLAHVFSYRIRNMQELLRVHSTTDPLTGAYNRRQLEGILEDCILFSREFNQECVLAIFDLDNFKRINDELGHNAGDDAIIGLVEILNSNSRSSDLVFRHGGDEMLLLLRDIDLQKAKAILEGLCRKVADSTLIPTTCSAGASKIVDSGARAWLAAADNALYKAKKSGKNQISYG